MYKGRKKEIKEERKKGIKRGYERRKRGERKEYKKRLRKEDKRRRAEQIISKEEKER